MRVRDENDGCGLVFSQALKKIYDRLAWESSAIADERTSIVGVRTFIVDVRPFIADGGTFPRVLVNFSLSPFQFLVVSRLSFFLYCQLFSMKCLFIIRIFFVTLYLEYTLLMGQDA